MFLLVDSTAEALRGGGTTELACILPCKTLSGAGYVWEGLTCLSAYQALPPVTCGAALFGKMAASLPRKTCRICSWPAGQWPPGGGRLEVLSYLC